MLADLAGHYFDPGTANVAGMPRVRPTDGGGGPSNGLVIDSCRGWKDERGRSRPCVGFWQMGQFVNLVYAHWKATGSSDDRELITAEWAYVRSQLGDEVLGGAGEGITVNASDDAAWQAEFLAQVEDVTHDPAALADLERMIPAELERFRDPSRPQDRRPGDRFGWPPLGMLYQTRGYPPRSTSYDTYFALAAMHAFRRSGERTFLHYAQAVFELMRMRFKVPASRPYGGVYYCELDLGHEPAPHDPNGRPPQRGLSYEFIAGTMGEAILAAELYRATGDRQALQEARAIAAAMLKPDTYLRTVRAIGPVFLDDRDPWTDGYGFPAFVREVLSLPGADAGGAWRRTVQATAVSIARQRTPDGYYGADWSGPEANQGGPPGLTYQENFDRHPGQQAGARQIMTSASAGDVIEAAAESLSPD